MRSLNLIDARSSLSKSRIPEAFEPCCTCHIYQFAGLNFVLVSRVTICRRRCADHDLPVEGEHSSLDLLCAALPYLNYRFSILAYMSSHPCSNLSNPCAEWSEKIVQGNRQLCGLHFAELICQTNINTFVLKISRLAMYRLCSGHL